MKVIDSYVDEIVFHIPEGYKNIETWLEKVGRTCYKSEDKITDDSAGKFVQKIYSNGHHAMLEHAVVSARIISDLGMSHELVRHRLASYAQESTRYCNYNKDKFGGEITVIKYPWKVSTSHEKTEHLLQEIERVYLELIADGEPAQYARAILPKCLKTEIVITANLRQWLHIFDMRCSESAHPIIRTCTLKILNKLNDRLPSIHNERANKFQNKKG
jgi:thymidylate synthase (FAD)